MNPEFQPIASPTNFSESPISPAPQSFSRVARWRWWVSLLVIGLSPLLASVASKYRTSRAGGGAMLPASVPGLLLFCAIQLAAFGVVWGVAWAFSRASREQLFLRPLGLGGALKAMAGGFGYSLLMRLMMGVLAIVGFIALALLGFKPEQIAEALQSTGENIRSAFGPMLGGHDPLYTFLLVTLLAFVVAGLREELWRAATLAAMLHLAPMSWSQRRKNAVSIGFSSVVFGLGHLYQGWIGVVGTAILGAALGTIMLRHRSLWPAMVAHGCFDALSFALLAANVGAK